MALGDGIRRNIAQVEPSERMALRDAILEMHRRFYPGNRNETPPGGVSWWFKQDEIHQATHVHGGPEFLPWHRELTNRFEALLRQINPQLSLHYWDFKQDPRNIPDGNIGGGRKGRVNLFDDLSLPFMGSSSGSAGDPWLSAGFYDPLAGTANHPPNRDITNDPVDPPKDIRRTRTAAGPNDPPAPYISAAEEDAVLALPDFPSFRSNGFDDDGERPNGIKGLEQLHNFAHVYFAAVSPHIAFRDPFVFLLHSNVDRVFARWQTDPRHSERLNPNTVYGTDGTGDRSITFGGVTSLQNLTHNVEPWSTGRGGFRDIRPWEPTHENQGMPHTYHDMSVVAPPSYDTNYPPGGVAGVITGKVTDVDAGTALADASVLIRSGSVIPGFGTTVQLSTNAQGIYTSPTLPPAVYEVLGVQSGFVPFSVYVKVAAPVNSQDLPLTRAKNFTVTGTVSDYAGMPIGGATVTLTQNSAIPAILRAQSNSRGNYTIVMNPGSFNGSYGISAAADSYNRVDETIASIKSGAAIVHNFRLEKVAPGNISGKVTDLATAVPIAHATVYVGPSLGNQTPVAQTGSDGRYLANVLSGFTYVTVGAAGYRSMTQSITVIGGQTVPLDFQLVVFTPPPHPGPGPRPGPRPELQLGGHRTL